MNVVCDWVGGGIPTPSDTHRCAPSGQTYLRLAPARLSPPALATTGLLITCVIIFTELQDTSNMIHKWCLVRICTRRQIIISCMETLIAHTCAHTHTLTVTHTLHSRHYTQHVCIGRQKWTSTKRYTEFHIDVWVRYSHEWRHATMSISLEILFELTSDHVSSVTALPPWPRLSDKLFHFSQRCWWLRGNCVSYNISLISFNFIFLNVWLWFLAKVWLSYCF